MRTVWIVNHYALPPGGAGGTRHYSLASQLVRHGWDVEIFAASVELNTGLQRLEGATLVRRETLGDIKFNWIRTNRYHGNGVGRMVNMLVFAVLLLMPFAVRGLSRPSVVVGSSVHPFAAWAGAVLASRFEVPFVFEVRDLWPETLIDLGRIRRTSFLARALFSLEKWLYQRADRIVVLPPFSVRYIESLGIPGEKVLWLPNGVTLEGFPYIEPLVREGKLKLMYFGAHGEANGLRNLLDAMAFLRDSLNETDYELELIGDGPQKPALIDYAKRLGLESVRFSPPVPKSQIPRLAASADAFIFNLVSSPVFRFGISSNKLFDFMAAGRPILFCCDAANNPVMEARAGITVEPDTPESLARAIVALGALSFEERAEMGLAARKYVELNHSFQVLGERFDQLLRDVSGPSSKPSCGSGAIA